MNLLSAKVLNLFDFQILTQYVCFSIAVLQENTAICTWPCFVLISKPRLLNLILLNLIVKWSTGAAIVRPPNTEYTQSIGACWEKLPKKSENYITAI